LICSPRFWKLRLTPEIHSSVALTVRKTMPKITIIIPAYNSAAFIGEALRSVFNQTYTDFEVVIVNDGSTDDIRGALEPYIDRVRYFRQENQGPAQARNRAIEEAGGEYIAFLDADDLWEPEKLAKQIREFERNPELGMIITENSLFDERGIFRHTVGKREYLMKGDIPQNIFLKSGVVTPTVMVRREVLDQVGVFEQQLRIAEDDNLWIRIAANYPVALIDEPLVKVRDHRNRTMRVTPNLSEYVGENVRLLTTKYGDAVRRRIEPVVPEKLYLMRFTSGYRHFEQQNYREARRAFRKALEYRRFSPKLYAYLAATCLPAPLIRFIQLIKRKGLPSSFSTPKWFRSEDPK